MNNPLRPRGKARAMVHYVGTQKGYDVEVYDPSDELGDAVAVARFPTKEEADCACEGLQSALAGVRKRVRL